MSVVVDALGKQCPIPVVMAKKALAELQTLIHWKSWWTMRRRSRTSASWRPAASCPSGRKRPERSGSPSPWRCPPRCDPRRRPSAPRMPWGSGGGRWFQLHGQRGGSSWKDADEGFLYAVSQLPTLPKTILFYNSGAYLTCTGSDSLEDLKFMEAQGVEIRTCGTCLDFYKLKETLAVGSITNMYAIAETLAAAGKVIKP